MTKVQDCTNKVKSWTLLLKNYYSYMLFDNEEYYLLIHT